jgi:signal transduction histidine kinase
MYRVRGMGGRPPGSYRGRMHGLRRHPLAVDLAIAAHLFAVTVLTTVHGPGYLGGHLSPFALLTAAVTCGALGLRRRFPFPVLAVTTLGAEAYLALSASTELVLAAPLIALYTVADRVGRRTSLTIGVLAVVAISLVHLVLRPSSVYGPGNLALAALGGLAIAAGDAARNRRAYLAEVEARARHAEVTREAEARRRVTEERLRIARDLHDVLGHHIALINVQAGVAGHVLTSQPAVAGASLEHIQQASRAALSDLRDTIGLLRAPGEPAAPVEPTLGLDRLPELLASFTRSGLRVTHTVSGAERPVPTALDITAYRVIQESLTNVRKHSGCAAASVSLGYEPAELRILVEDNGSGPSLVDDGGHGLAGMRERVTTIGGRLRAGPRPGGGFRVLATLPLA